MTAVRWFHARKWSSFHLTRESDDDTTLCGRRVRPGEQAPEMPGDQRTCERCLLIASKGDVFAPRAEFIGEPV